MAPLLRFLIPFVFLFIGLALWVVVGSWHGLLLFVLLFLIGSTIGSRAFKRLASNDQIRDDLEARLKND